MKFIQSKPFIFGEEQKIERVDEGVTRQFYGYDHCCPIKIARSSLKYLNFS